MFRKILVPLDGSPLSERILSRVRRLLLREDAHVLLLGVVPARAKRSDWQGDDGIEQATRYLMALRDRWRAEGCRVDHRLASGDPASMVLETAAEWRPDLIALSTHGRSGIDRFIRGSTAERILRGATAPLLLANPWSLEGEANPFRKILVPLDASHAASAILGDVVELARLHGSEVVLLHVIPEATGTIDATAFAAVDNWNEAEAHLESLRPAFGDLKTRVQLASGDPSLSIVDAAEAAKVDLVALSTHGRSGLSRWAFGSVAEQVARHCRVPLYVRRITG